MISLRMTMLTGTMLALVAGCEERKPAGRVVGTVTFQGKPVEGEVLFYAKDNGIGATAKVDASGKYEFDTPLPVATYAVAVMPPPPTPGDPSKPAATPMSSAIFPSKYRDTATSNLSVTVNEGENTLPIVVPEQ